MITKVRIEYFKRFPEVTFEIAGNVVLAGPNNSGKTTLLQAISIWNLCVQKWLIELSDASKEKRRTGFPVTRKDFSMIPLREMNLLWFNRITAYRFKDKSDRPRQPGQPKNISITLWGIDPSNHKDWNLSVIINYQSKEHVYVKLTDAQGNPLTELPEAVKKLNIVCLHPFSGMVAEETGLNHGYQNMLVGQGKLGDILRNLILEVYQKDQQEKSGIWKSLQQTINDLFGYRLLVPHYNVQIEPFIKIEYQDKKSKVKYDIASAGSGAHQVLTLLSFFSAKSASVFLLDEPDAHLQTILQRQVYNRLRLEAQKHKCQLIISTHSRTIIEDTDPEHILSFYGTPHRLLIKTHTVQVQKALKRLSSFDILCAEKRMNIIYLEDESDFKILHEFARIFDHPMKKIFMQPFFHPLHGRDTKEARAHFSALQAVHPTIHGVLLLDKESVDLPVPGKPAIKLHILRWKRYEIENYLLHPDTLLRFVKEEKPEAFTLENRKASEKYLKDNLPPTAYSDPLGNHDFFVSIAASKSLLPDFLKEANICLSKKEYFQIAAIMKREEIHPEVKEMLDNMAKALQL